MGKLKPFSQGRAEVKREIQRLLDNEGKNLVDVAKIAGVTKQTVSATLNGYRHSFRVLDALRSLGIPESLLFDPRAACDDEL